MTSVLLVDDSVAVTEIVRLHLEAAGYEVAVAGDVPDAREALAAGAPDIVLLDYELPSGTGFDVLDTLRSGAVGAAAATSTGVLMVTRTGDPANAVAALERGADDFIRKPFEPPELLARVAAVLRRRATPPAGASVTSGPAGDEPLGRLAGRAELRRVARAGARTGAAAQLVGVRVHDLGRVTREQGEEAGDATLRRAAGAVAEAVAAGRFGGVTGRLSGATLGAVVADGDADAVVSLLTAAAHGSGDGASPWRVAVVPVDAAQPDHALTAVEDALRR